MAIKNVPLPEDLGAFVEEEAARKGFATPGDYVESVLGEARKRREDRDRVDALLTEAIESGPAAPMTAEDWEQIRDEVRRRHEARRGSAHGPTRTEGQ